MFKPKSKDQDEGHDGVAAELKDLKKKLKDCTDQEKIAAIADSLKKRPPQPTSDPRWKHQKPWVMSDRKSFDPKSINSKMWKDFEDEYPEIANTNAYRWMDNPGDGYCLFYSTLATVGNSSELRSKIISPKYSNGEKRQMVEQLLSEMSLPTGRTSYSSALLTQIGQRFKTAYILGIFVPSTGKTVFQIYNQGKFTTQ